MNKHILFLAIVGLLLAGAVPAQAEPSDDPGRDGPPDLIPCEVVRIYTNNGVNLFIFDPIFNIVDFNPQNCYDVYIVTQVSTTYIHYG